MVKVLLTPVLSTFPNEFCAEMHVTDKVIKNKTKQKQKQNKAKKK